MKDKFYRGRELKIVSMRPKTSVIRILAIVNVFIITAGFFSSYFVSQPGDVYGEDQSEYEYSDSLAVSQGSAVKISENTKIIYEYLYEGDGLIERTEEDAPMFLQEKTRFEIEQFFLEWLVMSFTPDEVVLRKNVKGNSSQYYILGEYEGFIAVYYQDEQNGSTIKEITEIPIHSFPQKEQERLKAGIIIKGEESLIRALEDYGS